MSPMLVPQLMVATGRLAQFLGSLSLGRQLMTGRRVSVQVLVSLAV
jgi:hypothetical protein